jgi:hypothetical protein
MQQYEEANWSNGGDWIHRCMAIEKKIMKKTHSGMIGFSSDEEDPIASGDDELGRAGHEAEDGGG